MPDPSSAYAQGGPTRDATSRHAELTGRRARLEGAEPRSFGYQGHTSTPAWLMRFAGSARQLLDAPRPSVTARFDLREGTEAVTGNHARLPPPDTAD